MDRDTDGRQKAESRSRSKERERERERAMKIIVILTIVAAQFACAHAASLSAARPYTVLEVINYDGSVNISPVKIDEGLWRVRQTNADFRVWKEANALARTQWTEWFSHDTNDRNSRRWVLPNPVPPQFTTIGQFADTFDAEDKVTELKAELQKRIEAAKNADMGTQLYLDNLRENQKLLKEMLSKARHKLTERDEANAKRLSAEKRREIWDAVAGAEFEARHIVMQTADKHEELDILKIYIAQQKLLEPIYEKFKIDEGMWFIVWEEGDKKKWPTAVMPLEWMAANSENVAKLLKELKMNPASQIAQAAPVVFKNMGNAAVPFLIHAAEDNALGVRALALNALSTASGKTLGNDLAKWKQYEESVAAAERAEKAKLAAAAAAAVAKVDAPKAKKSAAAPVEEKGAAKADDKKQESRKPAATEVTEE
jgi:hypothetical protein